MSNNTIWKRQFWYWFTLRMKYVNPIATIYGTSAVFSLCYVWTFLRLCLTKKKKTVWFERELFILGYPRRIWTTLNFRLPFLWCLLVTISTYSDLANLHLPYLWDHYGLFTFCISHTSSHCKTLQSRKRQYFCSVCSFSMYFCIDENSIQAVKLVSK